MNSAQQMSVLLESWNEKAILNYNVLDRPDYGVYGQMYAALNADQYGNFPLQNTPEAKKFSAALCGSQYGLV